MGDIIEGVEDTIMREMKNHFDEKSCAFYPASYRPSQQDFVAELNIIRLKIRSLKAADKLEGKPLDDILGKYDELVAKRKLAIEQEKSQSRGPFPALLSQGGWSMR